MRARTRTHTHNTHTYTHARTHTHTHSLSRPMITASLRINGQNMKTNSRRTAVYTYSEKISDQLTSMYMQYVATVVTCIAGGTCNLYV